MVRIIYPKFKLILPMKGLGNFEWIPIVRITYTKFELILPMKGLVELKGNPFPMVRITYTKFRLILVKIFVCLVLNHVFWNIQYLNFSIVKFMQDYQNLCKR